MRMMTHDYEYDDSHSAMITGMLSPFIPFGTSCAGPRPFSGQSLFIARVLTVRNIL